MKTKNIICLAFALLTFAVSMTYAQKHVPTTGAELHAQSSNAP